MLGHVGYQWMLQFLSYNKYIPINIDSFSLGMGSRDSTVPWGLLSSVASSITNDSENTSTFPD